MNSVLRPLATVSAAALLAMAAVSAGAQQPAYGSSSFAQFQPVSYPQSDRILSVRAVLDQFDTALARHDIDMLQATGVNRQNARRWRSFFRNNPQATITDDCPVSALYIAGDSAHWACTETATIISEGQPRAFVHTIRFTFARNNGMWLVADRR
ncbi:MAG TPA: hypothetical protein VFU68_02285 [Terracidiphilus sp.]|nr:hypothetical protein [Terracidiphilus sp.]